MTTTVRENARQQAIKALMGCLVPENIYFNQVIKFLINVIRFTPIPRYLKRDRPLPPGTYKAILTDMYKEDGRLEIKMRIEP